MVSLFSSLNIASNALTVNESAISVVSHNVANMNTEGYSKQRVNLATRNIAGAIGNNPENQVRANGGVMIANVMRYNDGYLNNYYRDQLSKLKQSEQELGNLGDLSGIFNDLDGNGIDAALSGFYDALNNLNEYPASSTARVNFIESAKTLTSVMNSKSQQLDQIGSKALGDGISQEALENSKIYNQIEGVNDVLGEIAEINKALRVTQTGTLEANNLLDKRDLALNKLSEYVSIRVDEKSNGSVDVYTGDIELVKGAVVTGEFDIQTAKSYCESQGGVYPDDWKNPDGTMKPLAVLSIVKREGSSKTVIQGDVNDQITGGALGGLIHSADLNADGINVGIVQDKLNKLSQTLVSVFNDINTREGAYCIDPNNTQNLKATDPSNTIFVSSTGDGDITAGNISVNPNLLLDDGCWNLSCAYFADPDDFDINAIGNATNVVDMLGTRSQKFDSLNGMSIEDYYTALMGKIAAGGGNAQNLVDTQNEVVGSIENQISANNSVDLNEELVDLVKYQTAYAASAQVFNVVNSCLDTLMSLGR